MTVSAPSETPLPEGFRVRLTARHHRHGVLESSLRPAVARMSPSVRALLEGDSVRVGEDVGTGVVRRLMELDMAVPWPDRLPAAPALEDLTVVVPVRDRPAGLDRLLRALAPRARDDRAAPGPPVPVVDDASADPRSIDRVVRAHGARLLRLPANRGPAGARTAGIATVSTPYVALVDSDVTLGPADLRRLLAELADPLVAAVAPRVRAHSTPAAHPVVRYDQRWGALDLGTVPGLVGPGRRVSYVPTACWVARTEVLRGGFDETLRVGEDVDLAWRLVDRGWWVRYVPEVVVRHASRPGLRAWCRQHAGYGESSGPLARRHGPLLAPARYTVGGLVVAACLVAPAGWSTAIPPGVFAVTALRLRGRLAPLGLPPRSVLRLAAAGLRANLEQSSALVARYWFWPLVLAAPSSRRARRLLVRGVAVDLALRLRHPADLPLLALRVVENAAFAWGTVRGLARGGSMRALLPVLIGSRAGPRGSSGRRRPARQKYLSR
ncbi:glycosyltransferase [Citricoccus sp.]|uniref:glycosyltransferase n=1 Tax=Citricoccus sp. TaxID=1978372 RepID=UPI002605DD75|nr:glycosyltransferase [Citricoccus sp.]HRO30308.1 glycosyltransferase [Citricoccus sp.]